MKQHTMLLIMLFFILNACTTINKTNQRTTTLYSEIGGMRTINRLTSVLVDRLTTDQRLEFLFENTEEFDFQNLLSAQICYETGGGCSYVGLSMKDAHSGMSINTREFDIFVALFIEAMSEAQISYKNQNKLLKIFAPMRQLIIDK